MSNGIKIGDRVVCIKGVKSCGLITDRQYIVYDVTTFPCGCKGLDVGINRGNLSNIKFSCSSCYEYHTAQGFEHCFNAIRFQKVEENVNYVKLTVKTKKPCLN